MRKPRDFDSELKALADKAKQLKERRVQQLGGLVIATGADSSDAETLAGALLVIADTTDAGKMEAWRKRGAAFFQSKARNAPSLQPSWGVQDRKTHLLRAAGSLARQRLAKNIQRIDRAADRMEGRKRDGLGR
jgi:type II secretory pathway component PulK